MSFHQRYYLSHFARDIFIVVASIVVAVLLVRLGIIESFIGDSTTSLVFASFVAGAFFTSLFTVAPAGVALVAIGQSLSPVLVAFFAALGAVIIDMLIITFIRKDLSKDLDGLVQMTFRHHIIRAFHLGFLKWVAFLAGMFLIATPLPDEFGLFLIGISKVDSKFLPLIFFVAHFIGILVVVSVILAV